jgi:hypothetical protein
VSDKRSALDALSAAEKAAVLDELLAARPDLRQPTETYAAQVMAGADRSAVADDVEDALQGLGIEELNTRAGYRPRLAPHSRASLADALATVTLALTRPASGRPPTRTLRAALYRHAFNPTRRATTTDPAVACTSIYHLSCANAAG